jgi:two-component system sensor histidine kinase KdpD
MLSDGRARAQRGDDVVIGWVEGHGRAAIRDQAALLEWVPPRKLTYRDTEFEDLDVAGVLERNPGVVLVDELAHASVEGRKRYDDVLVLLAGGIHVMTTLNIANLQSARDVAARIVGAGALECVPDDLVRAGDVVLVDLPAEALRARIASGQVYSREDAGGALANYFQGSNLALLSKLAHAWLDGWVDEAFAFLDREATDRPRVIAGISSSTQGMAVIEHAAVLAGEESAQLDVVHVDLQDGRGHSRERLGQYREMAESVGARYREVQGVDAAETLGDLALREGAHRVVVGARRSRFGIRLRGSVAAHIRRRASVLSVDEVQG